MNYISLWHAVYQQHIANNQTHEYAMKFADEAVQAVSKITGVPFH